jgi:plasmid stability protein
MAPKWRHGVILEFIMPVSLSIKAVPDVLVDRLRRRAAGNHRSLQRELMAIVEAAVQPQPRGMHVAPAPAVPASSALLLSEPVPAWHVTAQSADDSLLEELDGIVAGSRWGEAPLLTREQLHDRSLARELDFDARQAERAAARKPRTGSAP